MTIALLVCSSLVINAKPGLEAIEARAIAGHVRFLADDLLEGRGTGERGHAIAERYVVAQMEILGLRPAGDGGTFLQQVLLREVEIDPERTLAELPGTSSLRLFEDYLPIVPSTVDADVTGPLVLVGYGAQVPEAGIDDFRDVELRGKIAVWLTGAPSVPALSATARA
ncbi:MAG: peptidase M28, partial [Myxococcales bacterium]